MHKLSSPRLSASFGVRAFSFAAMALGSGLIASAPAKADARSVREWTQCDGVTDDRDGMATALAAAAHGAFDLTVDCPLRLRIGQDISRPLFIDDGTTVRFTLAGSVTVDNVLQPAFVLASASNVSLQGWTIRYVGRTPLNPLTANSFVVGGAVRMGKAGHFPTSGAFNDITLTQWLAAHRGIHFAGGKAFWLGPVNLSAILLVLGQSSQVSIGAMRMSAPAGAAPDSYIPVAITFNPGFRNGSTVTATTPRTSAAVATPDQIAINGLSLDGYLMGIVGLLSHSTIEHVRADRYSDLQGDGQPVGGATLWFPPPHLIYIRSLDRSSGLVNMGNVIRDVIDLGRVTGSPRMTGGNACSLKIGSDDTLVDGYTSDRPDGVFQPLASRNLTIRNVTGRYNSAFGPQKAGAVRFVNGPYAGITLENIDITDTAPVATIASMTGPSTPGNSGIVLRNVAIHANHPQGDAAAPPRFAAGAVDQMDVHLIPTSR